MDYAYKFGDKLIRVQDDVPQTGLDVKNLWNKVNWGLEYGITNQVTVGIDVPFSFNAREEGHSDNYYTGHGWGDISFKGRYWLKTPDPRGWNFYISSSITLPSGSDAELDANGNFKKPYIVPGSGQWTPAITGGVQKGFGVDNGFSRLAIAVNLGHLWTLGENDAGYDSADAWYGSAGGSWIPRHFGTEGNRFFGLALYLTGIRIAGWDTRDGAIVSNTGGKWFDIVPGAFFTPDNGKFTVNFSVASPVYVKVHSLQTLETLSYSFGLAYRY